MNKCAVLKYRVRTRFEHSLNQGPVDLQTTSSTTELNPQEYGNK